MSLTDTDKNSEDRGTPMPNHSDKIIDGAIKSHKTLSTHYTTDADTNTGRLQMQNKQVLGNDGTTNITLYGYNQALNQWGFFVTKPGVEVTTNTDLSQFIFNSSQDTFKIVQSLSQPFSFTAPTNSSSTTVTITHNLGFIPTVLSFANITTNGMNAGEVGMFPVPYFMTGTNSAVTAAFVSLAFVRVFKITSTTIVFDIGVGASGVTLAGTIYGYVLQETAQTG